MPANIFNGFKDYGIGIGLRVPHYEHIFEKKPTSTGSRSSRKLYGRWRPSLATLDQILERYRVVQHGVSNVFRLGRTLE